MHKETLEVYTCCYNIRINQRYNEKEEEPEGKLADGPIMKTYH